MTRYLFLASSGKLSDGGLILNRRLSEALARGNDVHLATLGPCEQARAGVNVVELDENLLSPEATADIRQTRYFVDRFSKTIRAILHEQGPERVGLPTGAGAFDVIVGYGDVTGPAALHLKDTYYPHAKVSTVITLDPKGFFKTVDLPELGAHRIENHREVLARSDIILAHGPKSASDARELAAEWSRATSLPPIHEFVPGIEPVEEAPTRWRRGERFNVLMLGRMGDPNKGAVDAALAVHDLRENGYENIHLTLRGVGTEEADNLIRRLNEQFGGGQWKSFVSMEEFTSDEAAIRKSIRESHALLVATESEAYGLVANEYAAHGKPLIVADGYGNGFATLLRDEERFPSDIARLFVLDDSGSRSSNGSLFGEPEGDVDPVDRYTLIADRLEDLYKNYLFYAKAGRRLRHYLNGYSLDDTAAGIDQAVREKLAGNIRHTKQGPGGELLEAHNNVQGPAPMLADRLIGNDPNLRRGHREARFQSESVTPNAPRRERRGAKVVPTRVQPKSKAAPKRVLPGVDKITKVPGRERPNSKAAPQPSHEPQKTSGGSVENPKRHPGMGREDTPRTSSAIWDTPVPNFKPMAAHRREWGIYDDLHGYGNRPQGSRNLLRKTPSKPPGHYAELLHPNTIAAYERDQQQTKQRNQGYSR
ncbi:glycosyltransferase family 4 protein [Nocardiopsis alkaliphila]|uniref:glycosyltransferase family 4 protein n=1 Tax=Nocardiopsis alkaliphila TaxID=225762 RepID=UPI000344A733|nr:glycosyltransferase family 4 protein [Nocardiopsis alkaliphila]